MADQSDGAIVKIVEKYGKDKIVRAMLLQKAQDVVMNSAVYE